MLEAIYKPTYKMPTIVNAPKDESTVSIIPISIDGYNLFSIVGKEHNNEGVIQFFKKEHFRAPHLAKTKSLTQLLEIETYHI